MFDREVGGLIEVTLQAVLKVYLDSFSNHGATAGV